MSKEFSTSIRVILGGIGGVTYLGFLTLIGAITAGAGHGSYLVLAFTGIPVFGLLAVAFWAAYGLILSVCRGRTSSNVTLALVGAPYVWTLGCALFGKFEGDRLSGDVLVFGGIVIMGVSQLLIFLWWLRKRKAHGLTITSRITTRMGARH